MRHGGDFNAQTPQEYVQASQDFLNASMDPTNTDALVKVDPNDGTYRIYNPTTNTYGEYTASGNTITYFKPNPTMFGTRYATPMDWWNDVQGVDPADLP